ncbi:hypothetical protein CHY_0923 [Carboxydothermus hydrogenoformans Z-2901]|uniref:Uncharacterized protein n=1 Tax=Carboxydothermus hydrogenoformans (strain ATCC BAA-161 / DSM 6008 / Z-2901) TaxID=246194 RepID=Q3ADL4_CARHZ|nr:hypothetical protein CHY_0923 [Carboxydothermus hydrogenoformans Z-2901]
MVALKGGIGVRVIYIPLPGILKSIIKLFLK